MATAVLAPIVVDENGVAYVEGTTTKVVEVALAKQASGLSPEELQAELPHLTLAQVYGALAYYFEHQADLDADLRRREEQAEELRRGAAPSEFAQRVRGEGRLG